MGPHRICMCFVFRNMLTLSLSLSIGTTEATPHCQPRCLLFHFEFWFFVGVVIFFLFLGHFCDDYFCGDGSSAGGWWLCSFFCGGLFEVGELLIVFNVFYVNYLFLVIYIVINRSVDFRKMWEFLGTNSAMRYCGMRVTKI